VRRVSAKKSASAHGKRPGLKANFLPRAVYNSPGFGAPVSRQYQTPSGQQTVAAQTQVVAASIMRKTAERGQEIQARLRETTNQNERRVLEQERDKLKAQYLSAKAAFDNAKSALDSAKVAHAQEISKMRTEHGQTVTDLTVKLTRATSEVAALNTYIASQAGPSGTLPPDPQLQQALAAVATRAQEVQDLRDALATMQGERDTNASEVARYQGLLDTTSKVLDSTRTNLQNVTTRLHDDEVESQQRERDLHRTISKLEQILASRQGTESEQVKNFELQLHDAEQHLTRIRGERNQLKETLAQAEDAQAALIRERDAVVDAERRLQEKYTKDVEDLTKRLEAMVREKNHLEQESQRLGRDRSRQDEIQKAWSQAQHDVAEKVREIAEEKARTEQALREKDELTTRVNELEAEEERLRQQLATTQSTGNRAQVEDALDGVGESREVLLARIGQLEDDLIAAAARAPTEETRTQTDLFGVEVDTAETQTDLFGVEVDTAATQTDRLGLSTVDAGTQIEEIVDQNQQVQEEIATVANLTPTGDPDVNAVLEDISSQANRNSMSQGAAVGAQSAVQAGRLGDAAEDAGAGAAAVGIAVGAAPEVMDDTVTGVKSSVGSAVEALAEKVADAAQSGVLTDEDASVIQAEAAQKLPAAATEGAQARKNPEDLKETLRKTLKYNPPSLTNRILKPGECASQKSQADCNEYALCTWKDKKCKGKTGWDKTRLKKSFEDFEKGMYDRWEKAESPAFDQPWRF
jgi:DNA repair exonuclease SbcCD ATPase subunit